MTVPRIVLANDFHAGDVIMCRPLIKAVRPLMIDRVALQLHCKGRYWYLWEDLGLPQYDGNPEAKRIDMWFSHGGDLLGVTGMTYATHVTSYNRQARALDLPLLEGDVEESPSLDLPLRPCPMKPGVLVENGPVLSGQPTHDLNPILNTLAKTFPKTLFYCTGKVLKQHTKAINVVDCSAMDLIQIGTLSKICRAMLARLSAPFISTLTATNRGRMKRLVWGTPIGCPIWDERDVEYFSHHHLMMRRLGEILT